MGLLQQRSDNGLTGRECMQMCARTPWIPS